MQVMFKKLFFLVLVLFFISCNNETLFNDLQDTEWLLKKIEIGSDTHKPQKDHILKFTSDSTYTLQLSVNTCGFDYSNGIEGSIDFGEWIACTKICCDSDFSEMMIDMLSKVEKYRFVGKTMIFDSKESQLIFEAL